MDLPFRVVTTIIKTFPETGKQWIEAYPDFLSALIDRWQLTIEGRAEMGWPTNVVYFVVNEVGDKQVLKLGHPHPESTTEKLYLESAQSTSLPMVNLVDHDSSGYALLLERVEPGTNLREQISNQEAIGEALKLHLDLPRAPIENLPSYGGWMSKAFAEYLGGNRVTPEFAGFIEKAKALFAQFSEQEPYLLHGDLHHENILKGPAGYIAIDPKGVLGPKAMEFGRFFHNFLSDEVEGDLTEAKAIEVFKRRFAHGAEVVNHSEQLLIEVTYIDLTLALTWHFNSGETGGDGLTLLRALDQMI